METDVQVVSRQTGLRGDEARVFAGEVDSFEEIPVLVRQRREEPPEALAEKSPFNYIRLFGHFQGKSLQRPPARIIAPVKVDDGVTEDAVEPSHRVLLGLRFLGCRERLDEGILHQILGKALVAHPFPGESDEEPQVFHDRLFDAFHLATITFHRGPGKGGSKWTHDSQFKLARKTAI